MFTDADPAIGGANAALTIVEFSDFECPYCRQFFPTLREAGERYGDRLRIVYRDFPIDDAHPNARLAAEAAQCAHAQGKFWVYHDKLFQNAEALDGVSLAQYAKQVGIDSRAFDECRRTGAQRDRVEEDYAAGVALGVRGTPTVFLIPSADPTAARRVEGVIPREQFFAVLDRIVGAPR